MLTLKQNQRAACICYALRHQPTALPDISEYALTVCSFSSLPHREHDLGAVYRFASPSSQLLSGSYQRFVGMLSNAIYRPLFGHREARVLQSAQMSKDKACVVVGECGAA